MRRSAGNWVGAVAIGLMAGLVSRAWADENASRPAAVAAPAVPRVSDARVLSEGSRLVQVHGRMARREDGDGWWFVVTDERAQVHGRRFQLIPNSRLAAMEQALTAAQSPDRLLFELTGEVYVYQGRNYLLATHAPVVSTAGAAATREPRPVAASPDQAPGAAEDSAERIMAQVRQAVGTLPRSAEGSGDEAGASASSSATADEGAVTLWRRGQLRRGRDGAWLFVFDADASGLADPPVTLVPCLMLEQLSAQETQVLGGMPLLLSGRGLAYRGRGYLIPTAYRQPAHRTPMVP